MKLGCSLMGSGNGAKAVALARTLLAQRPKDPELLSALRVVLSHRVPQWHRPMIGDAARNEAFEKAIARAVAHGETVLDIGTGSGLLSLMAARAGAKAVYACEADPALAETAREIVARNGYAETIRVLAKRSTELDREADLGGGVDVVVAEIFSDDLLVEGALATFQHAAAALTRAGARIIPASASVQVALAFREHEVPGLSDVEGFDLSPFERHFAPDSKFRTDDKRLHLRSEPAALLDFDLQAGGPFPNERASVGLTASGGRANGVVRWLRLQLDEQQCYENRPGVGRKSHWAALFSPLPGRALEVGESLTVNAAHDQERIQLWFS
jgi:protein-L-isoaspartate O-methyltransferase